MAAPSHLTPSRAGSDEARSTVCLVDDHEVLRNALVDLLAAHGADVVAAVGTVDEGLRAVVSSHPSIAVIDNQLPDGRGVDLCNTLSTLAPGVSLILHSGTVTDSLLEEARDAGVALVVAKSIRGVELLAAIDSLRGQSPEP